MGKLYYNNKTGEILVINHVNRAILEEDINIFSILKSLKLEDISITSFKLEEDKYPIKIDLEKEEVIYKEILNSKEEKLINENAELLFKVMGLEEKIEELTTKTEEGAIYEED